MKPSIFLCALVNNSCLCSKQMLNLTTRRSTERETTDELFANFINNFLCNLSSLCVLNIYCISFTASAILWLEYCNLERQYGEPNQLRTIFKRALATNTDWPQCIAEEWLMYERETGTLEDILKCVEKTKSILKTQMVQTQSQIDHNQTNNYKREKEMKNQRQKRLRYEEVEQGNRFKKGL